MSATLNGAWSVRIRELVGNDTPDNLRQAAAINECDPEIGSAIAEGQRRHAGLIELIWEMERAISGTSRSDAVAYLAGVALGAISYAVNSGNHSEAMQRVQDAHESLLGGKPAPESSSTPRVDEFEAVRYVGDGSAQDRHQDLLTLSRTLERDALSWQRKFTAERAYAEHLRMSISDAMSAEQFAAWMIANGFTTGHGDDVGDLLRELAIQVNELRAGSAYAIQSRELLARAAQAMDDWIVTYASEFCGEDAVKAAWERISDGGGTLSYAGSLKAEIDALAKNPDPCGSSKSDARTGSQPAPASPAEQRVATEDAGIGSGPQGSGLSDIPRTLDIPDMGERVTGKPVREGCFMKSCEFFGYCCFPINCNTSSNSSFNAQGEKHGM